MHPFSLGEVAMQVASEDTIRPSRAERGRGPVEEGKGRSAFIRVDNIAC